MAGTFITDNILGNPGRQMNQGLRLTAAIKRDRNYILRSPYCAAG